MDTADSFLEPHPCIPLLQELEQERQQVFQKEQQIHQRMEKCTEESPSQTTKIVFIHTRFVFAKIVFLLCKLQTVVVCNKRYLSAVLWIRRYPWMESELESLFSGHYQIGRFQTEDNIPKVSSLFVWVVWRRKCLEMLTIHWHTVVMFGSFAGRQCTFSFFLDTRFETWGLMIATLLWSSLHLTSTFRRPSSATWKLKDNGRWFTRSA